MTHEHPARLDQGRAFLVAAVLNVSFVVGEVVFGLRAHSLALLADAGHNLSDVLGLGLAWGASWLSTRGPSERRTYGLRRATILAAVLNAVLLLMAVGGIAWEAVRRLGAPAQVEGGTVIAVAGAGILVNGASALLFLRNREHDLNIRGAFLHMAADAGVSLGVVLSGLALVVWGWRWLDPVVSLAVAFVITVGTWGLLRESVALAMDAVPEGIDPAAVERYLAALPGVTAVHDLHIWGMSTTHSALTVHLVRPSTQLDDAFLATACRELHQRFGIEHATIQVEGGKGDACDLAPDDVV